MADDGLIESGNINLFNRPQVKNSDGSTSTVRSMSVNINGNEVLLPTVSDDGRILSPKEAIDQYKQTGKHLGKYKDVNSANKAAQQLHQQQEKYYMPNLSLLELLKQKQLSPDVTQREETVNPVGPPLPEVRREEPATVNSFVGPPAPTANQATNSPEFMARALREFQQYKNPYEASANADEQQAKFEMLKNKLRGY